jgi:glycosyltransferase involved in cell wall biosynthesis
MKILFLDQSGKPGGAELCLIDIAKPYRDSCLVGLFADGSFRQLLEQHNIPVQVLRNQPLEVRKSSSFVQGLSSVSSLIPLIIQVAQTATKFDVIYANTQKALVVGTLASWLCRRPLVYHLHDILSLDHFSKSNLAIAVNLANARASLIIANSIASKAAFVAAGGRKDITEVVYNGFEPELYQSKENNHQQLKQELGLEGRFVVGHFSRLSPWKGQHILLEALVQCPENVTAMFVGDALFGEQDYAQHLQCKVTELGLAERVRFLGFRSDIVQLMSICNLVAHTSIAPEPFGRVIVEAMLCGRPIVAAEAGGVVELVEHGVTGWLISPGEPTLLAEVISSCRNQPELTEVIAKQAQKQACERFNLTTINQQIAQLLSRFVKVS